MQDQVFTHTLKVPFQDIDAAGVVFYAHLFRYAHEAYEHFMEQAGCSLQQLLAEGRYLLPLVHAQADYRRPLQHADELRIEVVVQSLGESSFTLAYRVLGPSGTPCAELQTVHVTLDKNTRQPVGIPQTLGNALAPYQAATTPPRGTPHSNVGDPRSE